MLHPAKILREALINLQFDEQLYCVFSPSTVVVPPLRARGADIFLLANHFLKKYSEINHKVINRFSVSAIKYMNFYNWPGNVKEMESVIENAVHFSENGIISEHHLSLNNKIKK